MTRRSPRATFFATPASLRGWLAAHHATRQELLVGLHKRGSGKPSITWPDLVDAALSFGWIDGVRRSIDAVSYSIRLTPRKRHSTWSAINVRRVGALIRAGLMHPAGLQAFRARSAKRTGIYSYEQRPRQLPSKYAKEMRENATAWAFFRARPPWYQRTATWWVVSAKKEETRLRRLAALIAQSAKGRTIGPLTPKAKSH